MLPQRNDFTVVVHCAELRTRKEYCWVLSEGHAIQDDRRCIALVEKPDSEPSIHIDIRKSSEGLNLSRLIQPRHLNAAEVLKLHFAGNTGSGIPRTRNQLKLTSDLGP